MKTRIEFTITEAKYIAAALYDLRNNYFETVGSIEFISFAHLRVLQKTETKFVSRLMRNRKKFSMILLNDEILALNYFAARLIRCEAEAFIRIILDKIFQNANDQLQYKFRIYKSYRV